MTTLIAPAKLNLFLAVGAIRPDGHHSVTTVLVALDGGDAVTVTPAERLSLTCEPDVGVSAQENLGWKAAVAMGEAFARDPLFAITIEKRIPAGAGLGGGSADAAAVIAAIAAAWEVDREDARLQTVARSLGADVPFYLQGGCGVYAGRGDVLRRPLPLPTASFAVAWPGVSVSTAAAYAAFDRLEKAPVLSPSAVTDALCFRDSTAMADALFNNMTPATLGLSPVVGEALAFMKGAAGCLGAAMAGSGSAVFGVFAEPAAAVAAARAADDRGWWSMAAEAKAAGTLEETMGAPRDTEQGRRRHPGRRRR